MASILSLVHLTRRINGRTLFEDLCLELEPGNHLAVLGPSGCGKTTLLRVIAGLDMPDGGAVAIGGKIVSDVNTWVEPHLRGVGFVFQTPSLWPHLTVAGNIRYGLHTGTRREADQRVADLLGRFSLEGLQNRHPASLSGGEARRVSIARSLAPRPALLLLDEPMTHLDDARKDDAIDFLLEEAQLSGTTLILVTHDEAEARRVTTTCLRWSDGMSLHTYR